MISFSWSPPSSSSSFYDNPESAEFHQRPDASWAADCVCLSDPGGELLGSDRSADERENSRRGTQGAGGGRHVGGRRAEAAASQSKEMIRRAAARRRNTPRCLTDFSVSAFSSERFLKETSRATPSFSGSWPRLCWELWLVSGGEGMCWRGGEAISRTPADIHRGNRLVNRWNVLLFKPAAVWCFH